MQNEMMPASQLIDCECTKLECETDADLEALVAGKHHPKCPLVPASVEDVLGDDKDDATLDALIERLVARKMAKNKGKCRGCGKKLKPDEKSCVACETKHVHCATENKGPFICPLCIADGAEHCILCLRPRSTHSAMCEVCDADAKKEQVAGSAIADAGPRATERDFQEMEERSRPPLRPAV